MYLGSPTGSFYAGLMMLFLHVVFTLRDGFHTVVLKAPTHRRETRAGLLLSWQTDLVLLSS